MSEVTEKKPWTVVVLGGWNKAILTPIWIATVLLQEPEGAKLNIQIAVNAIAPVRIGRNRGAAPSTTVSVLDDRLLIECEDNNFKALEEARLIAKRALEKLPMTPVNGVVINLSFPGSTEDFFVDRTWDTKIGDIGFQTMGARHARKVAWKEGRITTTVCRDERSFNGVLMDFNYRREDSSALASWLAISIQELEDVSVKLLSSVKPGGLQ